MGGGSTRLFTVSIWDEIARKRVITVFDWMQIQNILMCPNLVLNKWIMSPDGKIHLASLGNIMQLEMLTEITTNFEFVHTFMTRDFLLLQATDLNVRHHRCLPGWNASYSISQEICTRFLLCCALLWLYIDWFSHIHQAYFPGNPDE